MSLEYWYTLPVSILVATIAMASGVEGATLFAPFFILVMHLPPDIAIGTGLITEVFGFGSGLFAYMRKRLIDYSLGLSLLVIAIPAAILGTWASSKFAPDLLKVILGVGLVAVGLSFLNCSSFDSWTSDAMICAVIFDLDGTLVQTEKLKATSYARAVVDLCPQGIVEHGKPDLVGLGKWEPIWPLACCVADTGWWHTTLMR
jgi:Sulfite exporter TauE/SafE